MQINTTGKADIIIRSFGNHVAGGKTIKANQPITILKDVSYSLDFHSENREIRAGIKNLAAYSNYAPYQIRIEPINITESLAEILYKSKFEDKTFLQPITETRQADEQGKISLNYRNPDGVSISDKEAFVFDKSRKVISAAINYAQAEISDLTPESYYQILYYINKTSQLGYKLGKTTAPYFSLEIINRDNYGTKGVQTLIVVPKVSLQIEPALEFYKDGITNIPLVFNILEEDIEMIFH